MSARNPPWQYLAAVLLGVPDPMLPLPDGSYIARNRPRLAHHGEGPLCHAVERYLSEDEHLDEPLAALCGWIGREVQPADLVCLNVFARVTERSPGFGLSLSPSTLALISELGVTLELSVYVAPDRGEEPPDPLGQ